MMSCPWVVANVFGLEVFSMGVMKNALVALLLLTPLLAAFGTMAVNKRMAFFSDALGHSALAGVGLGMLLGIEQIQISLILFGLLFAALIIYLNQRGGASSDTNISVFSSTGIALGLTILSRQGRFARFTPLLVGDILAIQAGDLVWLGAALGLGLICWWLLYNNLLLHAVSPELAKSRGIRADLLEYAFAALLACAVMICIRWVGVLMINALLILPAAAARNVSRNAWQYTLSAVVISLLSGVLGLIGAYYADTSVGAAVVLCAAAFYVLSLILRRILRIA